MSGDTERPMAGVEIELVPWLTDFLDGRRSGRAKWSEGVVQGESVRSLLARLHRSHPRLAEAVYSLEESRLTGLVNVLLNERALELAGGLDAPLCDGDRLTLVPAYCGG